jgi:hypothetical protein
MENVIECSHPSRGVARAWAQLDERPRLEKKLLATSSKKGIILIDDRYHVRRILNRGRAGTVGNAG